MDKPTSNTVPVDEELDNNSIISSPEDLCLRQIYPASEEQGLDYLSQRSLSLSEHHPTTGQNYRIGRISAIDERSNEIEFHEKNEYKSRSITNNSTDSATSAHSTTLIHNVTDIPTTEEQSQVPNLRRILPTGNNDARSCDNAPNPVRPPKYDAWTRIYCKIDNILEHLT